MNFQIDWALRAVRNYKRKSGMIQPSWITAGVIFKLKLNRGTKFEQRGWINVYLDLQYHCEGWSDKYQ